MVEQAKCHIPFMNMMWIQHTLMRFMQLGMGIPVEEML